MKIFLTLSIPLLHILFCSSVHLQAQNIPTAGLVAWYPFNGNANDGSGNGNNGIINGGVTPTTDRFGVANGAYFFDGTSGYIDIPSLNNISYRPITYSAWVIVDALFPSSPGFKFKSIVGRHQMFQPNDGILGFGADQSFSGGSFDNTFMMWRGGGWGTGATPSSISIPQLNSWVHIAYTQDISGNFKVYQNGVLTNSGSFTDTQNYFTNFRIGAGNSPDFYFWHNKIDDVAIYSRVLSGIEVAQLYTAGNSVPITIPTTGLVAWYPFNGNANDGSGNGNNGVVNGSILTSDRIGIPNSAYHFNGVDNYISVPTSNALDLIGDHAISVWFRSDGCTTPCAQPGWQTIIGKRDVSVTPGTDNWPWLLSIEYVNDNNSFKKIATTRRTGGVEENKYSNQQVALNQWEHLVVTIQNGIQSIYLNGALDNTSTFSISDQPNGKNLNIGWSLRPGYEQFKGEIDDVAIYNRALSASEVMRLFDSAPTDINLSSNSILENVPIGASIGTLTAVDTEGGQMTYSLFAGAGDADNASFSIIGDQVKTASALDYETKSSYNIRIKVIDSGGLGFEKQLTISVINVINETMPTTGLVAWYPFNGNANDGSGNGNNGIINGASLTTDRFGTARNSYDFDGVNDYINVTNPTILNFPDGTNFTVSFFYDPGTVVTNPGGFNGIVARFTDNTGPATGWQIGRDIGSLRFEASNPCGNNTLAPIVPGNWIHIAQIYDRVAGVVRTYQNGVVVNTTSCSSITQSMINSYALKIGVEREGGQFSSGKIDDIAIYNRALDASEVMQLYTAVKSIQIISFSSLAQKTYGDEPFALTASSSSGLSVSYTSSNPSVASVSGNVLTVKAVGNVLITALQDGNGLFGAALPVQRTLTINKAMLTTTPDSKSRLYGEVNPALTIGYSGFKNGETISAIDTQPTASTTTTLSSNVGNYNIASSGGLDDNYDFTYVTGVMTISKATITAKGDSKTRQYGDVNPTFTISYSGFKNAETISVIDTQPVAITPATNTSVPGGYSIVVSGGVDNNYDFTYVNGTLTIISLTQGIVFTKLNDITETIHTFTLSASATSGLPITFSSTNNTKISVSGNTVTILGPGSVTIQAAQDGNGLYLAATPVSQTVCILPKKPIISATGLNTNNVVLTSSAAEGNQWYRNGTALPGATSSYVVDGKGSYTAKVTIENCQSNFSDPFSVIITDVEKSGLLGGLCLYPNPVQHELFINLNGITGDEPSEIIVYDISGRLICRQTMQGENGTLSIDQYPSGNYLLLISNKVFSLNTRFVKQ